MYVCTTTTPINFYTHTDVKHPHKVLLQSRNGIFELQTDIDKKGFQRSVVSECANKSGGCKCNVCEFECFFLCECVFVNCNNKCA